MTAYELLQAVEKTALLQQALCEMAKDKNVSICLEVDRGKHHCMVNIESDDARAFGKADNCATPFEALKLACEDLRGKVESEQTERALAEVERQTLSSTRGEMGRSAVRSRYRG